METNSLVNELSVQELACIVCVVTGARVIDDAIHNIETRYGKEKILVLMNELETLSRKIGAYGLCELVVEKFVRTNNFIRQDEKLSNCSFLQLVRWGCYTWWSGEFRYHDRFW